MRDRLRRGADNLQRYNGIYKLRELRDRVMTHKSTPPSDRRRYGRDDRGRGRR